MYLFKRSKTFYLYFSTPDGKLKGISTKTSDLATAKKFMQDFKKKKLDKIVEDVQGKTFQFYMFEFAKLYEHTYTKNTYYDMANSLKRFNKFASNIPLQDITNHTLQKFMQERIKISPVTANKELRYLKTFFNKAVLNEWIDTNPTKNIKQVKIPQKMPLYFTEKDFDTLLNVIGNQDFKDFLVIAVYTGMRLSEIINLQWNQIIDFQMILLDNNSHITKSKKIRSIPVNPKVKEMLLKRAENIKSHYVFTYLDKPVAEMEAGFINHKFKKYLRKTNLNQKLHFHSLRHTFASWLVQKNVPIQTVSQLLGHSSLQVTQIYAHLNINNLQSAVNAL